MKSPDDDESLALLPTCRAGAGCIYGRLIAVVLTPALQEATSEASDDSDEDDKPANLVVPPRYHLVNRNRRPARRDKQPQTSLASFLLRLYIPLGRNLRLRLHSLEVLSCNILQVR